MSTVATADFAAVMAQAARIYKTYDEDLAARALDAAVRAQTFLEEHPNTIAFDTNGYTGGYTSADVDDRRAHAELWVTTGEAKYLEAFETRAPTFHVRNNFDWPDSAIWPFPRTCSRIEGKSETIVEQYTTEPRQERRRARAGHGRARLRSLARRHTTGASTASWCVPP